MFWELLCVPGCFVCLGGFVCSGRFYVFLGFCVFWEVLRVLEGFVCCWDVLCVLEGLCVFGGFVWFGRVCVFGEVLCVLVGLCVLGSFVCFGRFVWFGKFSVPKYDNAGCRNAVIRCQPALWSGPCPSVQWTELVYIYKYLTILC